MANKNTSVKRFFNIGRIHLDAFTLTRHWMYLYCIINLYPWVKYLEYDIFVKTAQYILS